MILVRRTTELTLVPQVPRESGAVSDRLETTAGTAVLPVSTGECERGFSRMVLICTLDANC